MSLLCPWPPGSDESDVSTGTSLVRKRSDNGDKASKAGCRLTVLNMEQLGVLADDEHDDDDEDDSGLL